MDIPLSCFTPPHRRVFGPIPSLVSLKPSLSSTSLLHHRFSIALKMIPIFHLFIFMLLLFTARSSSNCVHRSKAAFTSSSALSGGKCGYGSMDVRLNGGFAAAVSSELYRGGDGCGDCYQITCKNPMICNNNGIKVTVTDVSNSKKTNFILNNAAFTAMVRSQFAEHLKHMTIDIEYKKVLCNHHKKMVKVEESSKKPHNLKVKFLGRENTIMAVDIARAGSSDWQPMNKSNGDVWATMHAPVGALQLRVVVTGKWMWAEGEVLPADWRAGAVYNSGSEITDLVQDGGLDHESKDWK